MRQRKRSIDGMERIVDDDFMCDYKMCAVLNSIDFKASSFYFVSMFFGAGREARPAVKAREPAGAGRTCEIQVPTVKSGW